MVSANYIFKSFEKSFLKIYIKFFKILLIKKNIKNSVSFIPLKKQLFTVLSSPHIDKKARNQFIFSEFSNIVALSQLNINKLDKISNIILFLLPFGVSCKIVVKTSIKLKKLFPKLII
uniref:Ribosomal protein S10 n=1 Tax=Glaucocystis nostochinearum TaxID=38271 RepID=E9P6B7_9EUKA|nr:ribosomal protein S10 [Glaucocystis nostochinearum]ADW83101.1 ribosomal protein S10 [Glaucocystis nostochinearum]